MVRVFRNRTYLEDVERSGTDVVTRSFCSYLSAKTSGCFDCSSIFSESDVEEGGMDVWRWLDTGRGPREEPWGTPLGIGPGRVRVSGADVLRVRSLGTDRDSGASVHMGVEGALAGPFLAQEDRGFSLIVIDGGNNPIFWFVASWMVRSNSLTSSIVMSEL